MEEEDLPFKHRISMSKIRWIRTYFLSLSLFPLRVLSVLIFVILYWMAASVTLLGKTESPMVGWRKKVKWIGVLFGRFAFRCMGLFPIIKGEPNPEAPVFVLAPHSSFFDAFVVFWLGEIPSIVNRYENQNIPFIGKCIRMTESIFVTREAANSRQQTMQEIIYRVKNPAWPKLALFPEGSTSNRKALMPFKKGAFVAGAPIQPVIIRYPNTVDTVTWTWDQSHGTKTVVWLTLSQIYTKVIVEFLPIYYPSSSEQKDPILFGNNVRQVMADALNIPVCQDSFEEVKRKYAHKYKSKKLD
ncbi:lysophosphatidylcholine acyltransferase 2B [Lepeophtheirus salmonis]|uniref:lysophosphatidylcholine acyltransferase 2B n=1 Tax=Lepeophtheirus salmonis TaxID=72036 RepID=UPI001AE97F4D|nr:lysophosphatidylcholine acyltransferase 2B-like [Lepeophtheirus salmonis]